MKIIASTGNEQIAMVYIAEFEGRKYIEMVESLQPPFPIDKKWVLIVSTLFGCPVKCLMCDAGGYYKGRLSKEEIFEQIDFLVKRKFPDGNIAVEKFKIQFARMGEPAFNPNVLDVLEELPAKYNTPGLIPSISTIAPASSNGFFERLLDIKKRKYGNGKFQLQFSIHTTDIEYREKLMPVKKWDFAHIGRYGHEFYQDGDRKIALNFALTPDTPLDAAVLKHHFDPRAFLIKITPLNPTHQAMRYGLSSQGNSVCEDDFRGIADNLHAAGYEVIVSIGELQENLIGSNCGQYLMRHLSEPGNIEDAYSYSIQRDVTI
jgi:23S rRNA (adenine2503-C2)-methyltransferase